MATPRPALIHPPDANTPPHHTAPPTHLVYCVSAMVTQGGSRYRRGSSTSAIRGTSSPNAGLAATPAAAASVARGVRRGVYPPRKHYGFDGIEDVPSRARLCLWVCLCLWVSLSLTFSLFSLSGSLPSLLPILVARAPRSVGRSGGGGVALPP